MKRGMAWSKKGSPCGDHSAQNSSANVTILGAIPASGLIKCSLRLPQIPAKKRKRGDHVDPMRSGTETGHDLSFLKATMDEMDKYPHMKGNYRYAYLPSYSLELKPIKQFWSAVKSKVKRNRFLEKETLVIRITEAYKCRNREQL